MLACYLLLFLVMIYYFKDPNIRFHNNLLLII